MKFCLKISLLFFCSLFVISQVPKELFAQIKTEEHIVINEVYYYTENIDTKTNEPEWIELYNKEDENIPLDGWSIADNNSIFYFPSNESIEPDGYLIIAKNKIDFEKKYEMPAIFEWGGLLLNNSGDELVLRNDKDEIIDAIAYGKSNIPGVISHFGVSRGKSLERQPKGIDTDDCSLDFVESNQTPFIGLPSKTILKVDNLGENFVELSWLTVTDDDFEFYELFYSQDLTFWEGYDLITDKNETKLIVTDLDPGKKYYFLLSVFNAEGGKSNSNIVSATTKIDYSKNIIINEILPRPSSGADFEFIELYNQSDKEIDLSGWMLDDIEGGSSPYIIPNGATISGKSYLVFYKKDTKIALNDTGDMARLLWPNGEICFSTVKYSNASVDVSWSKEDDFWYFSTTITPGAPNVITEPEEANEENIFEGSIEEVKKQPKNSWVKFYGIVTAIPGLFGKRIMYVQDENSGIRIYFYKALWPNLKIGDRVIIIGKISSSLGEFQVKIYDPSAIIIVESSKPPPPKNVKINEIDDYLIGSLIKVYGTVIKISGSTIWISDGKTKIRIYIYSYTGIKKLGLKKGDKIIISGILSKTSAGYRLLPRTRDEIKTIKYSNKKIAAVNINNLSGFSNLNGGVGVDYREDRISTVAGFYTFKIVGFLGLFSGLTALIILLILVNVVSRNAKNH